MPTTCANLYFSGIIIIVTTKVSNFNDSLNLVHWFHRIQIYLYRHNDLAKDSKALLAYTRAIKKDLRQTSN